MDFLTIRNQIGSIINLDESANNLTTLYNRWINETYKRVAASANWPWLLNLDVVQTVTDIETGTVAITKGDTALTFSSGPTPSVVNDYRIQISGSDNWYDITAHTAAATAATIADNFLGDTVTVAPYTLRKFWYSLPSNIDRIVVVTEATENTPFTYIDHRELKKTFPDVEITGVPYLYTIEGRDTSDNWRTRFFPVPSTAINVDFWYYKEIAELSANTDTPIFPTKWHEILIWGVLAWYGFLFRDDPTRRNIAMSNYNAMLDIMKKSILPTTDEINQIQPWDASFNRGLRGRGALAPLTLPGNFGRRFV